MIVSKYYLFFRTWKRDLVSCKELVTLCGFVVNKLELSLQFTWTNHDVVEWIKDLGFPEYQNTFKVNLINGRTLLLIDASALVKMNVKNFDHIRIITEGIRLMYNIELEKFSRSISLPHKEPNTLYKFYKIPTGPIYELCSRTEFFEKMKFIQVKVQLNHFEKLHKWLKHIPDFQSVRIGDIKRINMYFVKQNPHREVEKYAGGLKCNCIMPPCECNWSKTEKLPPWRLAFFIQNDEEKYQSICADRNEEIDLIMIQ